MRNNSEAIRLTLADTGAPVATAASEATSWGAFLAASTAFSMGCKKVQYLAYNFYLPSEKQNLRSLKIFSSLQLSIKRRRQFISRAKNSNDCIERSKTCLFHQQKCSKT